MKLSEFGVAVSGLLPPPDPMFNCTGTATNAPVVLTLIKPTSKPEVGAVGPTETVTESGVVPLVGETDSQLLFDVVVIDTANWPLVDVINKL